MLDIHLTRMLPSGTYLDSVQGVLVSRKVGVVWRRRSRAARKRRETATNRTSIGICKLVS